MPHIFVCQMGQTLLKGVPLILCTFGDYHYENFGWNNSKLVNIIYAYGPLFQNELDIVKKKIHLIL